MLEYATINEIQLRFPTPVLVKTWPRAATYNTELKRLIQEKRQKDSGVTLSNRGGWQSRDDFFEWEGEAVDRLSRWVGRCINQIYLTYHREAFAQMLEKAQGQLPRKLAGWANVNGRGQWNSPHNHPNCHWSGCYYVQVPEGAGRIAFLDPRFGVNMQDTGNNLIDLFQQCPQEVAPGDGVTVIFPSWLQHYVTEHGGNEDRISIAFNWRFLP